MSEPKDKSLYERVKARVIKRIPKHSAYRSGIIVKEYKADYKKKHGSGSAYVGKKKSNSGLSRWFKEDWKNQRGGTGYKKKGDIYRPSKRITKDTPTTLSELSKKEIKTAQREKRKTGRVKKFDKDK
jgi:hypothetical protein